jgi:hypothetical protein
MVNQAIIFLQGDMWHHGPAHSVFFEMPPHAWSGQKKIAVTAICKDGINYDQTFESTRATDMGGLREGNTTISHYYYFSYSQ